MVNVKAVVESLLSSLIDDAGGFKEQDFLKGVHDMLAGDSQEQKEARKHIRAAIKFLDQEDVRHWKDSNPLADL